MPITQSLKILSIASLSIGLACAQKKDVESHKTPASGASTPSSTSIDAPPSRPTTTEATNGCAEVAAPPPATPAVSAACTAESGPGDAQLDGAQISFGENLVREGLIPVVSIEQFARDLGVRAEVGVEIGDTIDVKITDKASGAEIAPTDFNSPYYVTLSGYDNAKEQGAATGQALADEAGAGRVGIAVVQEDGVVRIVTEGPGGFAKVSEDVVTFAARGRLAARFVAIKAKTLQIDQVYFSPPVAIDPRRLAVTTTPTTATVSWELPGSNGAYKVTATPDDALPDAPPAGTSEVFGYSAQAMIENLLPGSTYRFSVVAYNGAPPDRRLETPAATVVAATAPVGTPVIHLLFTQSAGARTEVVHAVRSDGDWQFDGLGEAVHAAGVGLPRWPEPTSHLGSFAALAMRHVAAGKLAEPIVAAVELRDKALGLQGGALVRIQTRSAGSWTAKTIDVPVFGGDGSIETVDLDLYLEADQTPGLVTLNKDLGGHAVSSLQRRPGDSWSAGVAAPAAIARPHVIISDGQNVQHRFAGLGDGLDDALQHDVLIDGSWSSRPSLRFGDCQDNAGDSSYSTAIADLRIDATDRIHGLISCRRGTGFGLLHFSGTQATGFGARLVVPLYYPPPFVAALNDLEKSAVAVANDGTVFVAYREPAGCPAKILLTSMAPGGAAFTPWNQGETITTIGTAFVAGSCELRSIRMAVDLKGKLHLAFLTVQGTPSLFYATNASGSWSAGPVGGGPGAIGYNALTLESLQIDGVPTHSNPNIE